MKKYVLSSLLVISICLISFTGKEKQPDRCGCTTNDQYEVEPYCADNWVPGGTPPPVTFVQSNWASAFRNWLIDHGWCACRKVVQWTEGIGGGGAISWTCVHVIYTRGVCDCIDETP